MLIWGKGFVFAYQNNLEFYCSSWWGIHLGAWIRNEKKKRLYLNYFKNDGYLKHLHLFFFRIGATFIKEPKNVIAGKKKIVYYFNKVVTGQDYFQDIRPCRNEVKDAIYSLLQPALRAELDSYRSPVIGVHVRRGDFKLGSTLTPNSFFIESIQALRKVTQRELSVEIFTDAHPHEISDLLALPNVVITKSKADILDILLLSRSAVCILSISSTFSLWAGFLSEEIVLKHPAEWHPPLRPESVNAISYEGTFDPAAPTHGRLIAQLSKIRF